METVLVVGGTGKTGGRVVERLRGRGVPVRVGSRRGSPPFDWEDRSTWAPALDGVGSAYLTYYPDLAMPGSTEAVGSLAELAVASGVPRLVLLSGRGEEEAQRAEEAVKRSGADWNVVRCSWFAQNFSESFLLDPILDGEVFLPAGAVGEPFVDAEDIADVVVEALTGTGQSGRVFELTGPRLLTFEQAIAEISAAAGRPIRYTEVSPDEFAAALKAEQVPPDLTWLMTYLFNEVLDGRNETLADGVREALGRPPRDFADYARATAGTGVWTGR